MSLSGTPTTRLYVEYLNYASHLTPQTNIPTYKKAHSIVRRRYSEFVRLHDVLVRENPGVRIPDIPPKRFFENRFKEDVIEERRAGFLKFLQA